MIRKYILTTGAAATLAFAMASGANAATLTLNGASINSSNTIPNNFDLDNNPAYSIITGGAGTVGSAVETFGVGGEAKTNTNGLSLDFGSTLRFTYLGSEAGFNNAAADVNGNFFQNRDFGGGSGSAVGASYTAHFGAGLIDFSYQTNQGSGGLSAICSNSTVCDGSLNISYLFAANALGGAGWIVLFGDGAGDSDLDDMGILVQAVPIPAPLALFLTGLVGLGLLWQTQEEIGDLITDHT